MGSDTLDVNALATGLGTTSLIIVSGLVMTATGFLPPDVHQSLEPLARKVGRPAVTFVALATVDFGVLEWRVVAVLLLCKVLVSLLAAGLGFLMNQHESRRRQLGAAALFAYCAVVSDDLALGLPVLTMLYPLDTVHESVPTYLFVIVAVQQLTIVPVMRALLEATRVPTWRRASRRAVVQTLRDRTVASTALAVAANLALGHHLPALLKQPVDLCANLYSGAALIVASSGLVGRLRVVRTGHVWVALALALLKTLVLPVLLHFAMRAFMGSDDDGMFDNFAFLYGTLPAGYNVVVMAYRYGVFVDEVSCAFVVNMVLSPVLMYVDTVLFNVTSSDRLLDAVRTASTTALALACAASVFLLLSATLVRALRRYPARVVTELMAADLVFAAAKLATVSLGDGDHGPPGLYDCVYIASNFARFSVALYGAAIALSLRRMFTHGKYGGSEWKLGVRAAAVLVPALLSASLVALGGTDFSAEAGESKFFQTPNAQIYIEIGFMVLVVAIELFCLVDIQLQKAVRRRRRQEQLVSAGSPAGGGRGLTSPLLRGAGGPGGAGLGAEAAPGPGPARSKEGDAALVVPVMAGEPEQPKLGGGVKFRLELLVCAALLGTALSVVVALAQLSGESTSGALAQLEMFIVFLIDGQAVFVFLLFGMRRDVFAAWARALASVRAQFAESALFYPSPVRGVRGSSS